MKKVKYTGHYYPYSLDNALYELGLLYHNNIAYILTIPTFRFLTIIELDTFNNETEILMDWIDLIEDQLDIHFKNKYND